MPNQAVRSAAMERVINLHIERLPEGVYLGTSEDVPGLVAQGDTVAETIEIARDLARIIFELREEAGEGVRAPAVGESIDVSVVVNG
jgi:predicted RNase H-like HicB family nuclease